MGTNEAVNGTIRVKDLTATTDRKDSKGRAIGAAVSWYMRPTYVEVWARQTRSGNDHGAGSTVRIPFDPAFYCFNCARGEPLVESLTAAVEQARAVAQQKLDALMARLSA